LGDMMLTAILLAAVAVGQTFVVRFLVGLNGMESDLAYRGWQIVLPVEKAVNLMRSNEALGRLLHLDNFRDTGGYYVLRSRSSRLTQCILLLAPAPDSPKKRTDLILFCYDLLFERITKTPVANELFEILQKHLRKMGSDKISVLPQNSALTRMGTKIALAPTMPRVLSWAGMATRAKGMSLGLGGLFVVMTILWRLGIATLELYLTVLAFVALDLILTLSPVVSERVSTTQH